MLLDKGPHGFARDARPLRHTEECIFDQRTEWSTHPAAHRDAKAHLASGKDLIRKDPLHEPAQKVFGLPAPELQMDGQVADELDQLMVEQRRSSLESRCHGRDI